MNLTKRGSKLRCSGCEKTKSRLYAIKGKILIIKTRTCINLCWCFVPPYFGLCIFRYISICVFNKKLLLHGSHSVWYNCNYSTNIFSNKTLKQRKPRQLQHKQTRRVRICAPEGSISPIPPKMVEIS